MAYLAVRTDKGVRKQVNEDACCIEVAQTSFGEVLMAVVCDGVGGLSRGDVASSTVIDRFAAWFERELPMLIEGMADGGRFAFDTVKAVWATMLQGQNELIRSHGATIGAKLGTTFTGIIACDGHYLVGHVGDCRAYRMGSGAFEQITEDQTLVAKRLAAGEITEEEARRMPKNVILQAVGTSRVLKPVFYEGSFDANDLFVICCDGAFKKVGNEGVRQLFEGVDRRDEAAMEQACQTLLQVDMDYGEKDNLTAVCFSGVLAGPGEEPEESAAKAQAVQVPVRVAAGSETEDDLPTMVDAAAEDEDDAPTMVDLGPDDTEDDLPTMVEPDVDEDDAPTMVDLGLDDEDDLATMVEPTEDEDDLSTMVDSDDEDDALTVVDLEPDEDEDDLPTMVEPDEDDAPTVVDLEPDTDEDDDLPTVVDDDTDEDDDAPTMVGLASDDEDDLPTMVEPDYDDEDDAPTMVEGADA